MLLVLVLIAGCGGIEGERAAGGCPGGEVCSPATPSGLEFRQAIAPREELLPIAVGGSQRFCMKDVHADERLELPFDVRFEDDVFETVAIDPPCAEVTATQKGRDHMRIVDPGTDELYDRLRLRARPAKNITTGPGLLLGGIAPPPHVLMQGATVWIEVRASRGDQRLAALRPDITTNADVLTVDSGSAEVRVPEAEEMTFAARVGDLATFEVMRVVPEVSSMRLSLESDTLERDASVQVQVGDDVFLCAELLADGNHVHGALPTFEASGDIELHPVLRCATIEGVGVGEASVVVRAPGARRTVPVEVTAAD